MEEIQGSIERITFQSPETGFTVAQLQESGKYELTCIVGSMPGLQPGEAIRCLGVWTTHPVHGRQFQVQEHHIATPADAMAIKKYLGSGLIKGIGSKYAERIVDKFGIDTLKIIDETPNALKQIPGLGKKRIEMIKQCWSEQKSIRELMLFLQQYDVSPSYAQKIFKAYGSQSIQKVTSNPFSLARDIFGIGFKSADNIAKKLGIPKDSPERIGAGIEYILLQLSEEGHVCYPVEELVAEAQAILEVDPLLIRERVEALKNEGRIELATLLWEFQNTLFVWSKPLFVAESGIAREVQRLQRSESRLRTVNGEKALEWVEERLHISLASKQKQAVMNALQGKMEIITGGPGTGKSTITKAILAITEKLTNKILLAAPTGRAAKRMTEVTGKKAFTIHSLLEYDFRRGGFKHNRENPLDCDLIIVDETSMIDTFLMYHLLKAIPTPARVILIGDVNQLPSVGPGNVLKDLIASNRVAVTSLTEIFRQAAGSHIITNAHRINQGLFPDISNRQDSDFFFIKEAENEKVLKTIVELVTYRVPKKYGFHPIDDIQVLAPMKKGVIGTENLNHVLQETLNQKKEPLFQNGKRFFIGDKVMQIRNNYKKEVFNGDIGRIQKIHTLDQQVIVWMHSREVTYDFWELNEIVLAYAASVHKYQGSECPCVIMPVHTSHFKLLHRNLIYTGVTRGKRLVILVGTKKALAIAVKNDEVHKRYTGLRQSLLETI